MRHKCLSERRNWVSIAGHEYCVGAGVKHVLGLGDLGA